MQLDHFAVRLRIVFTALLLAAAPLAARGDESTLAPLVNSQTPAVVRVSCQNIDVGLLVRVVIKVADKVIDSVIKDPDMAKKAKASLPLLVIGYVSGPNALFNSYKEAGLDEIYFVFTPGNETTLGFFAVPLGTLPEEKVEELKKGLLSLRTLNLPMYFCFERYGYLFAPVTRDVDPESESVQQQIRDQFDNLHSDPRPDIAEALGEFPGAAVSLVVTGNEKTSRRFAESVSALQENTDPRGAAASDNISGKMLRLGQEARYGTMVFDQGDASIKLRLRFKPGFDPTPTVNDIHDKLLGDILKEKDAGMGETRRALLEALAPVSAPEQLDWKIDEAYIQENMPIIREAVSLIRGPKREELQEELPVELNSDTK